MKALVDTKDNLVVDIQETEFEVHPDLIWVDGVPEECETSWIYDPETGTVSAPPEPTYSYKHNRMMAYPTMQAQLDMQYWDSVNGTTTWADAIAAVKAQYPKPE